MANLPPSFLKDGFLPAANLRGKFRRLMLGVAGPTDTGKSEFALSAPGPTMNIILDRMIDGTLDNRDPPKARGQVVGYKVIPCPIATSMGQAEYLKYWQEFYAEYRKALTNPDARTVIIDGDSDSWELQRLAEFGRLSKVPSNLYDNVNAARRAMYARAHDSGKIVIATNKVRKDYQTVLDPVTGNAKLNSSGNELREWTGKYEKAGFADQDYLWHIHVMTCYDPAKGWGLTITKCKVDRSVEGMTLWGEDCNFAGLVQTCYPHVPLKEWGF